MSTVYFPVSKYYLTNTNMKECWNTDCVVNKRSVEISNELCQSLLGVQIYLNFGQNSESESFGGRPIRISSKVDFNIIRDSNILLGLVNCGENVCFFNFAIQFLYSLSVVKHIYNHLSKE